MNIVFIVLTCLFIFVGGFLIGHEVADYNHANTMEDIMNTISNEDEKKDNKRQCDVFRGLCKQNIFNGATVIILAAFVLALNIWDYREHGMTDVMTGKRVSEQEIITKYKDGEPTKVDTVYHFHLKPNE